MVSLDSLVRGDCIGVDWVDITESIASDPDEAKLTRRHSIGYFWDRRKDGDVPVLITTTTLDHDKELGTTSQGYCIYPEACIIKVTAIKRKRRKKEKLIGRDTAE